MDVFKCQFCLRLLSDYLVFLLVRLFVQTTLRVWDVLFYEGAKVLFHVALAIFKVPVSLLEIYLQYIVLKINWLSEQNTMGGNLSF